MNARLSVATSGQGLYEITGEVARVVQRSGVTDGLCTVFVQHTSASLLIQENADPSVQRDLERWMAAHVPEDEALYEHADEGPDDMPAHIRAALTATSVGIPITGGRLTLGTWQGIYLWEHRRRGSTRSIAVSIMGT